MLSSISSLMSFKGDMLHFLQQGERLSKWFLLNVLPCCYIYMGSQGLVLLCLERCLWYFKDTTSKNWCLFLLYLLLGKADFGKFCAVRVLMKCFTVKNKSIQLNVVIANNKDIWSNCSSAMWDVKKKRLKQCQVLKMRKGKKKERKMLIVSNVLLTPLIKNARLSR